jgi:hypothetical protein
MAPDRLSIMRASAILLSLLLASTAIAAPLQDKSGKRDDVKVMASSDWDRVIALYKHAQGGAERFDGLRSLSFDFTPALFDEEGNEVPMATRHISYLIRPNTDEQERRVMRSESEITVPGSGSDEKTKIISIVTASSVEVWTEDGEGGFVPVEAKELQALAVFDAKGLWAQLDLILYPDIADLRCSVTGVMTRDSKRYMGVEAEFRPGRQVPEPTRLYFSAVSSLIERIDVFDPKTHLRTATTYLEGYKDHDGIKFPGYLSMIDRRSNKLGTWRFDNVKMNPELPEGYFVKP